MKHQKNFPKFLTAKSKQCEEEKAPSCQYPTVGKVEDISKCILTTLKDKHQQRKMAQNEHL